MVMMVVMRVVGGADIFHLVYATAFIAALVGTITRHLRKSCQPVGL